MTYHSVVCMTMADFVLLLACVQVHHGRADSDRKGLRARPAGVHGRKSNFTAHHCLPASCQSCATVFHTKNVSEPR